MTVDHIVPRKRGGGEEDSNLRSLCAYHASIKDNQDRQVGRRIAKLKRE